MSFWAQINRFLEEKTKCPSTDKGKDECIPWYYWKKNHLKTWHGHGGGNGLIQRTKTLVKGTAVEGVNRSKETVEDGKNIQAQKKKETENEHVIRGKKST